MVVVFALLMIFGKVAFVVSTRSKLIQKCKDACVASKWCDTSQEGVFSYACHGQTQRHNRTSGTDPGIQCTPCKSVFESVESQLRRDLHMKEDKKTWGVGLNMPPKSRQGYKKMTAGKTTFSVKKYTEAKTWGDALEHCRSDGGTLVTMNTRQKYRSVSKYASVKSHWIGLEDHYDNDTYFWTDGTPLTFSKWQRGQPSHYDTSGKKENCVDLSVNFFKGQGFNDQSCAKLFWFLCEI